MGAANPLLDRDRGRANRTLFLRTAEICAEQLGDVDGRVRATVGCISLSGWAPPAMSAAARKAQMGQVSLAIAR